MKATHDLGARHLLTRVDGLLAEGRPREAMALLPRTDAPRVRNARGVCLLRLGRPGEAVETLRDLVFDHTGFAIRPDADPVFQANYATALLLDGNAEGFWSVLGGIGDRTHPAVAISHRFIGTFASCVQSRILLPGTCATCVRIG